MIPTTYHSIYPSASCPYKIFSLSEFINVLLSRMFRQPSFLEMLPYRVLVYICLYSYCVFW